MSVEVLLFCFLFPTSFQVVRGEFDTASCLENAHRIFHCPDCRARGGQKPVKIPKSARKAAAAAAAAAATNTNTNTNTNTTSTLTSSLLPSASSLSHQRSASVSVLAHALNSSSSSFAASSARKRKSGAVDMIGSTPAIAPARVSAAASAAQYWGPVFAGGIDGGGSTTSPSSMRVSGVMNVDGSAAAAAAAGMLVGRRHSTTKVDHHTASISDSESDDLQTHDASSGGGHAGNRQMGTDNSGNFDEYLEVESADDSADAENDAAQHDVCFASEVLRELLNLNSARSSSVAVGEVVADSLVSPSSSSSSSSSSSVLASLGERAPSVALGVRTWLDGCSFMWESRASPDANATYVVLVPTPADGPLATTLAGATQVRLNDQTYSYALADAQTVRAAGFAPLPAVASHSTSSVGAGGAASTAADFAYAAPNFVFDLPARRVTAELTTEGRASNRTSLWWRCTKV